MKKTITLICIVLINLSLFAQSAPSTKIKKTFKKQYPEAVDAIWQSKGDYKLIEWIVLYKLNDVVQTSWYDRKANWIQTKSEIEHSDLPEAILKTIDEEYLGYKIVICARFYNPEIDGYEVFLNRDEDGFDVQFTKEGKIYNRRYSSKGFKPVEEVQKELEEK